MRVAAIAVSVVALVSVPAWSQQMPKPAPEMSQLDFFEGTWNCQGKTNASPFGPAGSMTSTARIQDDLGGFWQSGSIKGMMANMPPFEGVFHTTYDPKAKQCVMLWVDNMGGWARSTSSGWQKDQIVYEGEGHMPGQAAMRSRDTFTRSGASMKHVWEMQMDGKWMVLGEEACTKK
jgi:hypothetical protein